MQTKWGNFSRRRYEMLLTGLSYCRKVVDEFPDDPIKEDALDSLTEAFTACRKAIRKAAYMLYPADKRVERCKMWMRYNGVVEGSEEWNDQVEKVLNAVPRLHVEREDIRTIGDSRIPWQLRQDAAGNWYTVPAWAVEKFDRLLPDPKNTEEFRHEFGHMRIDDPSKLRMILI